MNIRFRMVDSVLDETEYRNGMPSLTAPLANPATKVEVHA